MESSFKPKKRIVTGCCEKSKINKTPYLAFPYKHEDYQGLEKLSDKKPKWCVMAAIPYKEDKEIEFDGAVVVSFCPFCGEKTPDIEINTKIKKKIHDTDSGDYCDTCRERTMYCKCLPPEFRWKVVEKSEKDRDIS